MKTWQKQCLFISSVCIFVLSVGCGFQNTAYKGMSDGTKSFTDKAVLGAQSIVGEYSTVSVNETGIFFFDKQERLSYYDYASGEKYIMCSNPKCSHNTEDCNAYMGEKGCYGGYALYDENIYVWYQSKDSAYMELAQMDSVGQEKKIIAEMLGREKTEDKETVFSLDLNTGKRRELFTTENGWFSQSTNDYLILEETSQYLVAKENGGTVYFVVKKSDFEKSGMDEAKKIYL